nr:MAG TPA: hypothetical protein [Caudoviricetes sp.]
MRRVYRRLRSLINYMVISQALLQEMLIIGTITH